MAFEAGDFRKLYPIRVKKRTPADGSAGAADNLKWAR
jgi:hypothetical protein